MKKTILLFAVLLAGANNNSTAQKIEPEFKFFFYFEDAAGNKDTICFGYDTNATSGIDTIFGEEDIKSVPFDTNLDVRIAEPYLWMPPEGYINFDPTTFHTKKQIINFSSCFHLSNYPQAILISTNKFPISVSWSNQNSFLDTCISRSILNHMNPGWWFDVGSLYSSGFWSGYYNVFLGSVNNFVYDSIDYYYGYTNKPPEYYIDGNQDTVRLLYFCFYSLRAMTLGADEKMQYGRHILYIPALVMIIFLLKSITIVM
jgi:hypothetical protein